MTTLNYEAEQYLLRAKEARAESRRRHLRVQELDARCKSITAKMNGMPGGGGDRHSLEQAYIALAEERDAELEAIKEENRKYHEVEDLINEVSEPERRAVLRHRYLRGLRWSRVEYEMMRDGWYYCDRQLFRLRDAALDEVAEILQRKGELPSAVHTEAASEVLHRPADEAG